MLPKSKIITALGMFTLLFSMVAVMPASAETAIQRGRPVGDQLVEFKRTAFEMRNEADALKSLTFSRGLNWQSHSSRLNALKDRVNEMGRSLAELEASKARAIEGQALAIEHARPHLVSVAANLTEAIQLVNENRSHIHLSEYREAVSDIYAQAEALHNKLDTILDYEDARKRFEDLELQSAQL